MQVGQRQAAPMEIHPAQHFTKAHSHTKLIQQILDSVHEYMHSL